MFTPRTYRLGDHVKITSDLSNAEGTFAAGHVFMIVDLYERHGVPLYDLRDSENRLLGQVGIDFITWATVDS